MDNPGGVEAEGELESTECHCAVDLVEGEQEPLVDGDEHLVRSDGIAGGGGEDHALSQPESDEQLGNLPPAAVPPVVDVHPPPASPLDTIPDPPQFGLVHVGKPSQAQYLRVVESFPELENGAHNWW
uniref:Uncharacterized protein n=1 Tax=Physcomitrium patens TaxID=3218 RepID=A0A2K1KD25_PHYPA|nr:hypothetical protein PHYPA_010836 [Physcomitrium patens]